MVDEQNIYTSIFDFNENTLNIEKAKDNTSKHYQSHTLSDDDLQYIVQCKFFSQKPKQNQSNGNTHHHHQNAQEYQQEDGVHLIISNGSECWKCEQSWKQVISEGIEIERHIQLVQCALKNQDTHSGKFSYDISTSQDTMKFLVKFIVKPNGTFIAARFLLKKVKNPAKENISLFEYLIEKVKRLEEQNHSLTVLAQQRNDAISLAQQTVEEKNKLEHNLYCQFLQIINAKKAKVRELDSLLLLADAEKKNLEKRICHLENALKNQKHHEIPVNHSVLLSPMGCTTSTNHETPLKKRRRNALSVDPEDLLDDLLNDNNNIDDNSFI